MGMRRSCTCGCWSEVQQECLYTGSGCFYDDGRKKPEVTEEWIDRLIWIIETEATRKEKIKRAKQMLKEAGVGVVEK